MTHSQNRPRLLTLTALVLAVLAPSRSAHGQPAPVAPATDMSQAVALLNEARQQYQKVKDYECLYIKRERINGTLLPECVMSVKVRNQPFSVYMRCESPQSDKGLEACYVQGKNNGKMRVNPAGMFGLFGFWSVDTRDPRAFAKNRHCITEAGLGHLLDNTARYWEMERRVNKTVVRVSDDELLGRRCTRIETIHPDRNAGTFYGYRCVLWLDGQTHLPLGAETYDWPRQGGTAGGDLLEWYRYHDLRCNVGLGDGDFDY